MKTTQQPSRRRLLSWAFALLAIGTAGIIPWQLIPREALAQDRPPAPPAQQPAPDGERRAGLRHPAEGPTDSRGPPRARRGPGRSVAEANAPAAAARREYRRKQRDRIDALVKQGSVEHGCSTRRRIDSGWLGTKRCVAEADIASLLPGMPPGRRSARPRPSAISPVPGPRSSRISRPRTPWQPPGPGEAAERRVEQAEAEAVRAASRREYRGKQFDRINEFAGGVPSSSGSSNEEQDRFHAERAEEAAAKSAIAAARTGVYHAEAAVREAEARYDLAAASARNARDAEAAREPKPLKEARARLHRARVDRAHTGGRPLRGGGARGGGRGDRRGERRVPDPATGAAQATGRSGGDRGEVGRRGRSEAGRGPQRRGERRGRPQVRPHHLKAAEAYCETIRAEPGTSEPVPVIPPSKIRVPFKVPNSNLEHRGFTGY